MGDIFDIDDQTNQKAEYHQSGTSDFSLTSIGQLNAKLEDRQKHLLRQIKQLEQAIASKIDCAQKQLSLLIMPEYTDSGIAQGDEWLAFDNEALALKVEQCRVMNQFLKERYSLLRKKDNANVNQTYQKLIGYKLTSQNTHLKKEQKSKVSKNSINSSSSSSYSDQETLMNRKLLARNEYLKQQMVRLEKMIRLSKDGIKKLLSQQVRQDYQAANAKGFNSMLAATNEALALEVELLTVTSQFLDKRNQALSHKSNKAMQVLESTHSTKKVNRHELAHHKIPVCAATVNSQHLLRIK